MESRTKNIITGIAGIIGLALLTFSVSAKNNGIKSTKEILITDHDGVWDYKISEGVWYTRKKGSNDEWINMKQKLADSAYKLAIDRLTTFLKNKGYDQTF